MNKKTYYNLFFMFLLIGMFLINFVSAEIISFDNKLTWSNENKNVNIKDLFGLGKNYADLKITSHESLDEPISVSTGYQRILIQEIKGNEDYNNFIGTPKFLNMKTDEYDELSYYWEKATYGDVPNMQRSCIEKVTESNGTIYEECSTIQVGTKKEIVSWERFDIHNIKKGDIITIALVVYVERNVHYDAIPKFFGKEIDAWAEFTSPIYDAHGQGFTGGDGQTARRGQLITLKGGHNVIVNVTKDSAVTATTLHIVTGNATTELGNATFVGNVAFINLSVTANENYYLAVSSLGAAYDRRFTNVLGGSYNVTGTNVDWIDGTAGGIGEGSRIMNIESVTTGDAAIDPSPTIELVSPVDSFQSTNTSVMFNCSITQTRNANFIENITLVIDGVSNRTILNGTSNFTEFYGNVNFSLGSHTWNCNGADNATVTQTDTGTQRSFTLSPLVEETVRYNTTAFETEQQTFEVIVTSDGTETLAANFFYDGTNKGASTKTGTDSNATFTTVIDIPTVTLSTNRTFFWNVSVGSSYVTTTSTNHSVEPIYFTICNASNSITYMNLTFKNETIGLEKVNATLSSTWFYYLSSQTINKTFSSSNATENGEYRFCFSPANKKLNLIGSADYSNSYSQQRRFTFSGLLTNSTTERILYLLPTNAGLFSPFATLSTVGDPIGFVDATVTRLIGGTTTTIAQGTTDSSGFITFFLNPDVTHGATFSKSTFPDNVFSFVPTADIRNVFMGGGGVSEISNGTSISSNTTITILPSNSSLNNGTDYTFSLEVSSTQTITFISMNITNTTGDQILYQSTAGQGIISGVLNTGNQTRFIGRYIIETADETIGQSMVWIIGTKFIGDYSIFRQFTLFNEYGFDDFFKFGIILAVLLGLMIFMSGGQLIQEPDELRILVALAVIWAFSIVGWLDTGLVVHTTNSVISELSQYGSQYGIAIVLSILGVSMMLKRLFT